MDRQSTFDSSLTVSRYETTGSDFWKRNVQGQVCARKQTPQKNIFLMIPASHWQRIREQSRLLLTSCKQVCS